MKKILLVSACLLGVMIGSSVSSVEIKKTNINPIKSITATTKITTNKLSEKDIAFQKQFQMTINNAQKSFNSAKSLAGNAHWELASILLDKAVVDTFKQKQADIANNKELELEAKAEKLNQIEEELVKTLNTTITAETFDYNTNIKGVNEGKYKQAVTNLQIANNRYDNITNNLSPDFKKILDGQVSINVVKTQLKDSGKLALKIQGELIAQHGLLQNLNKINAKNNIYINIPDSEKVVYNKDGVVGGINYQLDSTNAKVDKAYAELINAFDLKNKIAEEKAKISSNPDLTQYEKDVALKQVETEVLAKAVQEQVLADANGKIKKLDAKQSQAVQTATNNLLSAGNEYLALSASCVALGMRIYQNPILAVPLVPEVKQLKYTVKILKESGSGVKKVTGQTMKLCKANNIKIEVPKNKTSATKTVNFKNFNIK